MAEQYVAVIYTINDFMWKFEIFGKRIKKADKTFTNKKTENLKLFKTF